jgi:hypothetical protein
VEGRLLMPDLQIPAGYGFHKLHPTELAEQPSMDGLLQIWEHPRTRGERRYVVSVDVADGIGLDRSVIDVTRVGTVEEPEEQVAQYLSRYIIPYDLAFVIFSIGNLYTDHDHYQARVAIETNNHGSSTQENLQLHLGYSHFFRWEYIDSADARKRFSNKIGWQTNSQTRPTILDHYYRALTQLDPVTGLPDYVVNSPFTMDEWRDFRTETGRLADAEAARGAHDDCIMAGAIGHYVCWKWLGGELEPISERRHRKYERLAAEALAQHRLHRRGGRDGLRPRRGGRHSWSRACVSHPGGVGMRFEVPDDLVDQYATYSTPQRPVQVGMVKQLTRFAPLHPDRRVLVLDRDVLKRLETILGGAHLQTSGQLLGAVEALASLHIGEVRVDFTPRQLDEITRRAAKNRRTFEEEFRHMVNDNLMLIFDTVGTK